MITSVRKNWLRVSALTALDVHVHGASHTYVSARLQSLDNGAPVTTLTVAREVGHASETMVKEIYGHVADVRDRTEGVAYRS
jgi:integrase